MDTKEVSDSKKIRRQPAVTNLHSPQPPVDIPHNNELKNGDEDEGYSSKPSSRPSSRPPSMVLSPSPSQTSLHSTPSTANIPSTIPESNEDLEVISFGFADHKAPKVMNSPSGHSVQSSCAKKDSIESTATNILILPDNHHEGGHSSQSEELEELSSKLALLIFTGSSAHQSFQKCSLCNSQLKPRKLSYQYPPLHPRVDHRRGSEAIVSTKPLQSEKEPTCIMCRRNSQKTSPPPKRKLSKGYIFKATPMRRWNSQIITALYDEDDPESPFRKVRVTTHELRRMSKTISAKDVLKATCVNEELTERELLDIADRLEPDVLFHLALNLSISTVEYLRMEESHQKKLAYMILYKWLENRIKGKQNRKELIGVLFDLKKVRLAEMVASKNYH